jgi:hypothetical protein
MAYLAYATHGLDGDGEGGVVVLVHEKWKHRIRDVTRAHSQGRTHGAQWRRGALAGTIRGVNRRHTAHVRTAAHPSWNNLCTPNPSTHTNWNSFALMQAHYSTRAQMDPSVELRRRVPGATQALLTGRTVLRLS